MTAGGPLWSNWAGTVTCRPVRTVTPGSVDELCAAVASSAGEGLTVRMVGSGHSFTDVAATTGVLLRPDRLRGITSVDAATGQAVVLAGTPLHELGPALFGHGLAMSNLGDIDRQTLAGALATGTHGTGARFGGIAAQVVGLELVTPTGDLLQVDAASERDLFDAARVGLGAFGVIARVTLQCVPAFGLRAVERPAALDAVLDGLDDFVASADHTEFYWFPHTRRVLTKANTRVGLDGLEPLPRARAWLDDELLSNTVFEWANRLATRAPAVIGRLNALSARALTPRSYSDRSYRVFASSRRVVFREMEYALPRAALGQVLAEVDAWLTTSGERVAFPCEVRFAPPDDAWLSTAYGRETAYLAVHQYHRRPHQRYFDAVEAIAGAVGGRPHWGKLHGLDADRLRRVHPRLDDAIAVRDRVDPSGVFANAYTDRVLGRPDR